MCKPENAGNKHRISKYKKIRIRIVTDATDIERAVEVYAVEDGKEILMQGGGVFSFVIEVPPAKVLIKVQGKGKYSLYVWGYQ